MLVSAKPMVAAPSQVESSLGTMQRRTGNEMAKAPRRKVRDRENLEAEIEIGHHSPIFLASRVGGAEMTVPPLHGKQVVRPFVLGESNLGFV